MHMTSDKNSSLVSARDAAAPVQSGAPPVVLPNQFENDSKKIASIFGAGGSRRIAYLVNQYPQASHSFIRREIAALEARGITVHRFTVRRFDGPLPDPADQSERDRARVVLAAGKFALVANVIRMAVTRPGPFFRTLGRALKIGFAAGRPIVHLIYVVEAATLVGWLTELNVSHLHAHFGTNSTTVAMFTRMLGGPPYSFTTHGPTEFDAPMQLALGEKVHRAAASIVISEYGRAQMLRWCDPADRDKIHIVHCVVDALFLDEPANPPPAAPKLVCVGRLSEQKGHLALIAAAAKLRAEGLDFEITLIGDGALRPVIEKLISDADLGNHVKLAGWQSGAAVKQAILNSRALVLPSFAEGLPVAIMEALALHRPVVTTFVAGIPELVEHGVNGWLAPVGAIEPLAAAMRAALTAPVEQLAQMGAEGARRVSAMHSPAIESAKLAAVFAGKAKVL
jgi:colanic acid/amylovoran biosynthesis glycosyltransferase